MKLDNINPRLLKYHLTFDKLHIPFLALTELYTAYYRGYIAGMVNNRMGMPRSFVLLMKDFLVTLVFFCIAVGSKKSFAVSPKAIPFIIMTGLIQVSVNSQLFSRSQIDNGPFITACYQPIVPAISTLGAILLNFEKGTTLKYIGIVICLVATGTRLFYDEYYDIYGGRQFVGKYFLFLQVIYLSLGSILQKKIVSSTQCSLVVLVFYIYCCALLASILIFNTKYWNDTFNEDSAHNTRESYQGDYITYDYFNTLLNIFMIYGALIMCECFRYITLIYINKKGHISKVTLYGGLNGFFVIIMWLIFESTFYFDYFFISMITLAYICLFFSKYTLARIVKIESKQKTKKVKFVRAIQNLEEADQLMATSKIVINGKYFYESNNQRDNPRGILFSEVGSQDLKNSYYGKSAVGQKQVRLKDSYDKHFTYGRLMISTPIARIDEEDEDDMMDGNARFKLEDKRGVKTSNFVNANRIIDHDEVRLSINDDGRSSYSYD